MAAVSSGGTANGKSWCGWDLEQIKHFKHLRGWPGLARSLGSGARAGGCTARRGRLLSKQMGPARVRLAAPLRSQRRQSRGVPLEGTSRKLVRRVVNELFFWNSQVVGDV